MKFSIITPTLNQGNYIEDTITSVLNQHYLDFEHIIIDGGSSDGTIDILKKYKHIKWISEKDFGQSNAINKGFKMAEGDIIAWINSDDYYDDNVFGIIANHFKLKPKSNFVYGDITFVDKEKNISAIYSGENLNYHNLIRCPDIIRQPSCFWRKTILDEIGFLNENLHLVMDLDFFIRIGKKYSFDHIDKNMSFFRCYPTGKSSKLKRTQFFEIVRVIYTHEKFYMYKSFRYLFSKIRGFLKT